MLETKEPLITYNGKEYVGSVAKVERTHLGWEERGFFTVNLYFTWEGTGQGFGGYAMDEPSGVLGRRRKGTDWGMEHMMRIMEAAGVSTWEELNGKTVIVLHDKDKPWGYIRGLANPDKNTVYIPDEHTA